MCKKNELLLDIKVTSTKELTLEEAHVLVVDALRSEKTLEACTFTEFKSLRESDQLKYVSKLLTMIQGGRNVEELDTQELIRFERIGRYSEGS